MARAQSPGYLNCAFLGSLRTPIFLPTRFPPPPQYCTLFFCISICISPSMAPRTRKGNNLKAPTVQAGISEPLTTNTLEQSNTPTKGGTPLNAHTSESAKSPRKHVTRRTSALPGSPLHTPRKRTNEHPGLIGKVTRRSKQEVAAERAAKAAKKKAEVDKKTKAKERLATMEVETAAAEHTRKKNVIRRLPAIHDKPNSSVGEDFDWDEGGSSGDSSDSHDDAAAAPSRAAGDKTTVTTTVQVKVIW